MKYEFHVGDYVSYTANGKTYTGYVREYMHPAFSNEYCFVFQWDDGTQIGWSGHIEELPHNFVRIGQYDFTKSKRFKKIKQLEMEKDNVWNERCGGWLYVHQNKINEIIEAVNRLEEKVNEMA